MHLISLEVQNYLRVELFHITPQGKHVIISARNGEGKTSIVTALFDLLCGISQKKQPEPVHRGADKSFLRLELEDYIIEKHITNGAQPRLKVTKRDGTKVLTPQKLLDGWINTFSLDPVAWLKLRPQDQLDKVLEVCNVVPPVAQVKEITGADHPALPGESANGYMMRLSEDERGLYFQSRRDMGRQVDDCSGAVKKQEQLIASLPVLEDVRAGAEIMDEIGNLEAAQAEYQAHQRDVDAKAAAIANAKNLLDDLKRQSDRQSQAHTDAFNARQRALNVIAEQQKIVEAQASAMAEALSAKESLESRMTNGKAMIGQLELTLDAVKRIAVKDQAAAIAALRQEWKRSNAQAEELTRQKQAEERLSELIADHAAKKNRHKELDAILERLRLLRKTLLEGVDFGVSGLAVGNGELLLDDLPFSQASMAKSLRVALAVIMRQDADLKLIRIDNGEMLDSESMELVLRTATERGWQVIMTRVSNDKELRVELVDGEVIA